MRSILEGHPQPRWPGSSSCNLILQPLVAPELSPGAGSRPPFRPGPPLSPPAPQLLLTPGPFLPSSWCWGSSPARPRLQSRYQGRGGKKKGLKALLHGEKLLMIVLNGSVQWEVEGESPWGLGLRENQGRMRALCLLPAFMTLDTAFYHNLVVTNPCISFFISISSPAPTTFPFSCSLPQ